MKTVSTAIELFVTLTIAGYFAAAAIALAAPLV
jgi:hypothetical protein